jgi:single-strand DNA-binding protein
MADLNNCTFSGRLTREVEMKATPNGKMVAHFCVACNGFKEGEVIFIESQAWGKTAEACEKFLRKGEFCIVAGRIKMEEWTKKDGTEGKRQVLVVENLILGPKARTDSQVNNRNYGGKDDAQAERVPNRAAPPRQSNAAPSDAPMEDDDLPF